MCYTEEEACLISGVIQSYFAPQSVSEQLRMRYWVTHQHLQQDHIDHADLMNIQAALSFIAPCFNESRQTQKELYSALAKTDRLLSMVI